MCGVLLFFLGTVHANDAAILDGLATWHVCTWDEVDGVCAWNAAYALGKKTKFVCKALRPDVTVLVQLEKMSELKGVASLMVICCTRGLFRKVCLPRRVQFEELKHRVGC